MDSHKKKPSPSDIKTAKEIKENELSQYPADEDIYSKGKKMASLDPNDISEKKPPLEKPSKWNEKNFKDDKSGGDLDVPGAELDDQQESVGSEDEENNYYSLGGDDHNDLDEDKG